MHVPTREFKSKREPRRRALDFAIVGLRSSSRGEGDCAFCSDSRSEGSSSALGLPIAASSLPWPSAPRLILGVTDALRLLGSLRLIGGVDVLLKRCARDTDGCHTERDSHRMCEVTMTVSLAIAAYLWVRVVVVLRVGKIERTRVRGTIGQGTGTKACSALKM